jgi:hypothetical protein
LFILFICLFLFVHFLIEIYGLFCVLLLWLCADWHLHVYWCVLAGPVFGEDEEVVQTPPPSPTEQFYSGISPTALCLLLLVSLRSMNTQWSLLWCLDFSWFLLGLCLEHHGVDRHI